MTDLNKGDRMLGYNIAQKPVHHSCTYKWHKKSYEEEIPKHGPSGYKKKSSTVIITLSVNYKNCLPHTCIFFTINLLDIHFFLYSIYFSLYSSFHGKPGYASDQRQSIQEGSSLFRNILRAHSMSKMSCLFCIASIT